MANLTLISHYFLADVAEIFPGVSLSGRLDDQPHGPCHVILPRHVSDDGQPIVYSRITRECQVRVRVDLPSDDRLLQVGDILFISRGEKNRSCLIAELPSDGPSIALNIFHVLRPNPQRVVPAYLTWMLNQAAVQDVIKRSVRTSSVTTPMVPRKDFGELRIALPSLELQRQIADLAGLMLREQYLRRRLADLSEQRNLAIGARLLTPITTN